MHLCFKVLKTYHIMKIHCTGMLIQFKISRKLHTKCANNVVNLAHFIIFFLWWFLPCNSWCVLIYLSWFLQFFCLGVCGTFIQNAVTKTYKLKKCMWINTYIYYKVFLLLIFLKCQSGIFVNLNVLLELLKKQCQVEDQDYSAKSRIWALQNFTGTIEI